MKISFVMLTWNRKEFVKMNLESFYKNVSKKYSYEFIIMDNGSDDGTVDVLKEYSAKDPCMKIIYNKTNEGLQAYKKLFKAAKGKYIIELDDDVIEYPENFDFVMVDYLTSFKKVGILALDVVQNEYTTGAKPPESNYSDCVLGNKTVQLGPCGGWCCIFKRIDYHLVRFFFERKQLNMALGEDGLLNYYMQRVLRKKCGIIKNIKCLHASGPFYSKKYNYLKRDLQKYEDAKLTAIVEEYKNI